MLLWAILLVTMACLLYTIGVWTARIGKNLKLWHVVILWTGFLFDGISTGLMTSLAGGTFRLDFHGITGVVGLSCMLFLALWAAFAVYKKNEEMKRSFYRWCIPVWAIWLIPMLSAMILGANR